MGVDEKLSSWKHLSVVFLFSSWLTAIVMLQLKQEKLSCSSHHPRILPVWFSLTEKYPTLYWNKALFCKYTASQRGAEAIQGTQWSWYICVHLQPTPPTASHLFSPPNLGARPLLSVDTQSINGHHHLPPLSWELWESWLKAFPPCGSFIPV